MRGCNVLFSVLAQFFEPEAINDRLILIETLSFTTSPDDMMEALTRIIADRSDGALFFGNYYMMDYELRSPSPPRAPSSDSNHSCRLRCHSTPDSGRCGSRRGRDPLPSPTCRKRCGRLTEGFTSGRHSVRAGSARGLLTVICRRRRRICSKNCGLACPPSIRLGPR